MGRGGGFNNVVDVKKKKKLDNETCSNCIIRKNCFTTNYFKGCLDALLINDEKNIQSFMKDISIIHQIPI